MSRVEFAELKTGLIMEIDRRAVKLVDVSTFSSGKHGAAKKTVVAIDIFTGKKVEDMFNHHSQMSKPNVKICDLIAISIDEDDYVSAMSKSGKDMHTIRVSNEKLAQRIGDVLEDYDQTCYVGYIGVEFSDGREQEGITTVRAEKAPK